MFPEGVNCLLKAIEIYTDMGRFTMAAKHHQTIAEMYETEAVDLDRAVQHYEQVMFYDLPVLFFYLDLIFINNLLSRKKRH